MYLGLLFFTYISCHIRGIGLIVCVSHFLRLSPFPRPASCRIRELHCVRLCYVDENLCRLCDVSSWISSSRSDCRLTECAPFIPCRSTAVSMSLHCLLSPILYRPSRLTRFGSWPQHHELPCCLMYR